MHDGGKVQKLVCDDGTPKGAELILKERGFNTDSLVLDDMKTIPCDFKNEKSAVDTFLDTCLYSFQNSTVN